jgi:c-di-GMP-binding flagellar brake protein YcgR
MLANILKINQKIELEIKQGPYQGKYISKVSDLTEEEIIIIPPYVNGEILPLRINQAISVYFTGDLAVYKFYSRVIERFNKSIPLLKILHPDKVLKIQRRDYFRLDAKKRLKYRRLDSELNAVEDFKETTSINISGGGLKIILQEALLIDTRIEIFLDLPELNDIPIIGKIVKVHELPDGLAAGVEFVDLDPHIRELIIAWLFEHQRELRRKGLL